MRLDALSAAEGSDGTYDPSAQNAKVYPIRPPSAQELFSQLSEKREDPTAAPMELNVPSLFKA